MNNPYYYLPNVSILACFINIKTEKKLFNRQLPKFIASDFDLAFLIYTR